MKLNRIDHIAINVRDVSETIRFYDDVLGMEAREESPGKWSVYFGISKISIRDVRDMTDIGRDAIPGSANFCVVTDKPLDEVQTVLESKGVKIVAGPGVERGAVSQLLSIYVHDPDGNLVEISNPI